MKKIKQIILMLGVLLGLGMAVVPAGSASAINVYQGCKGNSDSSVCKASGSDNATSMVKVVIDTLLFVLGMIAVVMIVIGGIRYTTSAGNASQIKEAKDTILFSIVGLVVAILSFVIVNFVVGRFS